jgi:hypothetical protein
MLTPIFRQGGAVDRLGRRRIAPARLRPSESTWKPLNGDRCLLFLDSDVVLGHTSVNHSTPDAGIRHMGPMARDFYAAFGLGETPTGVSTVDADGVALAAIQGLYTVVQEKESLLEEQRAEIAALTNRVAALESMTGVETSQRDASTGRALPWLLLAGLSLLNLGGAAGYMLARLTSVRARCARHGRSRASAAQA